MIAPAFFFTIGIFVAVNAYRKRMTWYLRGAACMILLAPISYFINRSDAHWTTVPLLVLTTAMIFSIVMGMIRREAFSKANC